MIILTWILIAAASENAAIAHAVVLLERAPRNVRRKSQKKLPR